MGTDGAMKLIPTPTDAYPNTTLRVTLSGATYTIRWLWNQRDRAWTFGMDDPNGEPLVAGVRVVCGLDLLAWVPMSDRRPPYGILVYDPSLNETEVSREALGQRVKVVYAEPST